MKIALVGAFGNLGFEILKKLALTEHELVALDLKERETELKGRYSFKAIDATNVESLQNIFDG